MTSHLKKLALTVGLALFFIACEASVPAAPPLVSMAVTPPAIPGPQVQPDMAPNTPPMDPSAGEQPLASNAGKFQTEPQSRVLLLAPHVFQVEGGPRFTPGIRPVDPATLADLEGYVPLDLQASPKDYALSPDGRTLAAVAWHDAVKEEEMCGPVPEVLGGSREQECRPYRHQERRLHLVDVASWTEQVVPVGMGEFLLPTFSADGKSLYVKFMDSSSSNPRRHALHRYDIDTKSISLVTELPADFNPFEMRLLASGERLAMYGATYGREWERPLNVVIVDLKGGRVVANVRLDGVTDGVVEVANSPPPYRLRWYQAGIAWDLERDRLFVAHPDTDEVTVVDLNEGRVVKQAEIQQSKSLLGRLFSWIVQPVYAKAWHGGERRVALSSDGGRLFITGTQGEWDAERGTVVERQLGLRVVSTQDMRELSGLDLPVSDIALSPDGALLLLGSTLQGNPNHPTSGLYVLEVESLGELAHLEAGVNFRLHGFSPDSRYAYASSRMIQASGEARTVIRVFELQSLVFVSERSLGPFNPPEPLVGVLQ